MLKTRVATNLNWDFTKSTWRSRMMRVSIWGRTAGSSAMCSRLNLNFGWKTILLIFPSMTSHESLVNVKSGVIDFTWPWSQRAAVPPVLCQKPLEWFRRQTEDSSWPVRGRAGKSGPSPNDIRDKVSCWTGKKDTYELSLTAISQDSGTLKNASNLWKYFQTFFPRRWRPSQEETS